MTTAPQRAGLRPEAELLFAALSVGGDGPRRLAAFDGRALDWAWILERADRSRVMALVAEALSRAELAGVPTEIGEAFAARWRGARVRHVAHLGELAALTRALEGEGLELLAYKGPALGELLYDDPGLREYADLDVLVRPPDLERAREIVLARGWRPLDEGAAGRPGELVEADCEESFVHSASGVWLELHWRLLPGAQPQDLAVEALWRRSLRATWAGASPRVFEPVDLLLALCLHAGEKHRWMRLQMLADVAHFLVRHPDLDHGQLLGRARATRLEESVLLGLYLAWLLLEAPLAPALLEAALRAPSVRARAALVRGRLFRAEGGLAGYREWRGYLERAGALERERGQTGAPAGGRARYLLEIARPEWSDRQSWPLPRGLRFLHWGWRPLRLVRRLGPKLGRRLR